MAIKIEKKIVGYSVVDQDKVANEKGNANVVQIGEPLGRPDQITGSTYKVKTPVTEHALYITINDIVMNEGTPKNTVAHLKFLLIQKIWSIFSG